MTNQMRLETCEHDAFELHSTVKSLLRERQVAKYRKSACAESFQNGTSESISLKVSDILKWFLYLFTSSKVNFSSIVDTPKLFLLKIQL